MWVFYFHNKTSEEDGWSGSCLLYKLTATVHLCVTSREHPNWQFLMNSQFNRVFTQSNRVDILFDCRY